MSAVFKPYDPTINFGMFGYPGYCCDIAMRNDSAEQAEECWRRGWMDYDTRMLIGTVGQEAERRAPNVAKRLRKLGPCKTEPMRPEEFAAAPVAA